MQSLSHSPLYEIKKLPSLHSEGCITTTFAKLHEYSGPTTETLVARSATDIMAAGPAETGISTTESGDSTGIVTEPRRGDDGRDRIFMDVDGIEAGSDFVDVIMKKVSQCNIHRDDETVSEAVFDHGDQRLLTHTGYRAHVWDVATHEKLATIELPNNSNDEQQWLYSPEFAPNGEQVLTRANNQPPWIWDAGTGNVQRKLKDPEVAGFNIRAVRFGPEAPITATAASGRRTHAAAFGKKR